MPLIQLEFLLADRGGPELLTASQIRWQAKALLLLEVAHLFTLLQNYNITSLWKQLKLLGYVKPILT